MRPLFLASFAVVFAAACGSGASHAPSGGTDATVDAPGHDAGRKHASEVDAHVVDGQSDARSDGGLACPPFEAVCGAGADAFCAKIQVDPNNCGGCGLACPTGTYCSEATCGATCIGLTSVLCSGTCVDTQSDSKNCGACAAPCPTGQVCSAGACGATCASTYTRCGNDPDAYCAQTTLDPDNCGTCGTVCAGGGACSNGQCATASGVAFVVSGGIRTSGPSPTGSPYLAVGAFELGPLTCNAQGVCVTGGIVP